MNCWSTLLGENSGILPNLTRSYGTCCKNCRKKRSSANKKVVEFPFLFLGCSRTLRGTRPGAAKNCSTHDSRADGLWYCWDHWGAQWNVREDAVIYLFQHILSHVVPQRTECSKCQCSDICGFLQGLALWALKNRISDCFWTWSYCCFVHKTPLVNNFNRLRRFSHELATFLAFVCPGLQRRRPPPPEKKWQPVQRP